MTLCPTLEIHAHRPLLQLYKKKQKKKKKKKTKKQKNKKKKKLANGESLDVHQLMTGYRKCSIFTQWNIIIK
jgi:hypothetical protein